MSEYIWLARVVPYSREGTMGHRGYLTRGDKLLIVIAVAVSTSLAILGWPFLVIGLAALCIVLIVVLLARTVVEWFIKRRRPVAGGSVRTFGRDWCGSQERPKMLR